MLKWDLPPRLCWAVTKDNKKVFVANYHSVGAARLSYQSNLDQTIPFPHTNWGEAHLLSAVFARNYIKILWCDNFVYFAFISFSMTED